MTIGALVCKSRQVLRKHVLRSRLDRGIFHAHGRLNIGDSMVPWLIGKLAGGDFPLLNPREMFGPNLFSIGSVLQYAGSESVIWGSGFIAADAMLKERPAGICGVRGPLTLNRLKTLGIEVDVPFFDPSILASDLVRSAGKPRQDRIGVVMHYADKSVFPQSRLAGLRDVVEINVETDSIEDFVAALTECHLIVSTSLHGIILAEAFGMPAVWAKCGGNVAGNDFKFHDYYRSTGREGVPLDFFSLDGRDLGKVRPPPANMLARMKDDALSSYPPEFRFADGTKGPSG